MSRREEKNSKAIAKRYALQSRLKRLRVKPTTCIKL